MPDETTGISEKARDIRPRLLFHGTDSEAGMFIESHGLLAEGVDATLTPSIEIAMYYGESGILTMWYPLKGESKRDYPELAVPTAVLSEENRTKIRNQIKDTTNLSPERKENLLDFITRRARTFLPLSRLGAIINLTEEAEGLFHSWDGSKKMDSLEDYETPSIGRRLDFLNEYVNNKDEIVGNLEKILNKAKIEYFIPEINNKSLAEDIVRAKFEHYLMYFGLLLSRARKISFAHNRSITKDLSVLEQLHFNEPVYERYRQMLVSGAKRLLEQ